jgi:hypothetical protein
MWLLDPKNITNFKADKSELELMILFWILAAGKNGVTAAKCLDRLLTHWEKEINKIFPHPGEKLLPFDIIQYVIDEYDLAFEMKRFGIGCFNNKAKSFKELIKSRINLSQCTVDDLEAIYLIGAKTARCFLLHSRPNQKYAGLDRHVLKFMADQGIEVPKSTPNGKKYCELEIKFLEMCGKADKTPAEYDLEIWRKYSGRD